MLKKADKLSSKYNLVFCKAHNLTLSIKVSKELGLQNNLIKDSHKAIELWKDILDQPLAINGLIFAYIDLGLIFSDFNLNSLALKYLNKAESLIPECSEKYYPFIKLCVAYTVVVKDSKKIEAYNKKVIDIAKSKKDSMTLIPVLTNIANGLIKNKKYDDAKKKCLQAIKISDDNKESIYKPHIHKALGLIFLNKNKYKQSLDYFGKALAGFENMNSAKMIPDVLCHMSQVLVKDKEHDKAVNLLNKSLRLNKKIKNYDLDVKILKELSRLCGLSVCEIQESRIETVRALSREWNTVILLKGAYSVIGSPEGAVFINPFANPGLATAGSGDVLSGIIGGFLAQGLAPLQATLAGAYLHGSAAECLLQQEPSLILCASDLFRGIGMAHYQLL